MRQKTRKYYTLSNDKIFKNIFLKDSNLLKWLLNSVVSAFDENCDINIIGIENTELAKDRIYIKNKTVDALINTNYAYFNIEVNNDFSRSRQIRNLFYITSIFNNKIKIKEDYNSIDKRVIQINFNYNQKKTEHLISKYTLINEYYSLETYLDLIYIINIDVARIVKFWYNELRKEKEYYKRYKYILVMGMDEEKLEKLKEEDHMVKKIKDEMDKLNGDKEFYQALSDEDDIKFQMNSIYNDGVKEGIEQGLEQGIEQGIEQGLEQGVMQANINNAKKMKNEKCSLDLIKKITGLDINTINNL